MVFANAALPLAGVVDTFVIGLVGDAADLGGVALGGTLFSVFYWSFYFLRMSTTGLAAQADGAGRRGDCQQVLARALLVAAALGALVTLLRGPAALIGFAILQGPDDVEATGATYFMVRSWGALGAFASFAFTGWLIGLGRTRAVFLVNVIYSATNMVLSVWFVLGLGWGVPGVAAATAISEFVNAAAAGLFVLHAVRRQGGWAPEALTWPKLLDRAAMKNLFAVNFDLMLRTWSLVAGFSWFANVGARLGASVLAGNHVLLQIVSVWAFVLDAYAFVAETEVGRAVGAKSVPRLRRAIRLTSEFAAASGFLFMALTLAFGPSVLTAWIADEAARESAIRFLPYTAVIALIGAFAWQLDGVFIGATRARAMRNAALAAVVLYLAVDFVLTPALGPHGAWLAFLSYYVFRAGSLAVAYPALERSLKL
jgi:MATE family multidrug resistance protein